MYKNISIIGAGTWGLAIGEVLASKVSVNIHHYNKSTIDYLKKNKTHPNLPNHTLSNKINFNESKYISTDLCILATPLQYMRSVLSEFKIDANNILILSKGIECDSLMLPSDIVKDTLNFKSNNICILSGPSHAELLIKKEPTTIVVSSLDNTLASLIQSTISTNYFRAYINRDIIGVQLGGAVKNVISIASGIASGLGYKENTISGILTRSLKEISLLGKSMGSSKKTIWGLACIGDLIATSFSKYSRNRQFGIKIGEGQNIDKVLSKSNMVIEGVQTSRSIFDLSKKHEIEMPICNMVYNIIYKKKSPKKAINELMQRPLKDEK